MNLRKASKQYSDSPDRDENSRMPGGKKARKAKALQTTDQKEMLRESERRLTWSDQFREFYTVGQLADLLQLNEMTIYRMVNRGDLPCLTIGRMKRFRRGEIEEFLEQCRVSAK